MYNSLKVVFALVFFLLGVLRERKDESSVILEYAVNIENFYRL